MKRAWFALALAVVFACSSGCCLVDRIFHCHHGCGWCGPSTYEDCCWEGHDCGGCGGCDSCGGGYDSCGGGCDTCGDGYAGGCSDCGGSEFTGPMEAYDAAHTAHSAGGNCASGQCAGGRCNLAARRMADYTAPAGPPTGAITYPYYTNRGPRDFLARNPGSIGP